LDQELGRPFGGRRFGSYHPLAANATRRESSYLLVAMMIAMAVNLFAGLRSAQPFPELPKMPSSRVNMETREVVLITAALMFPLAVLLILLAIFRRWHRSTHLSGNYHRAGVE
jgi:hypothetical protein